MGTEIGSVQVRTLERDFLKNDGVITLDEAKKLREAAKAEDPAVITQILASDHFEPAARKELGKLLGKTKAPGASSVAGTKVGDATITKTLGDPRGYATRYEAIAAARLSGVKPAGVVLAKHGDEYRYFPVSADRAMTQSSISVSGAVPYAQGLRDVDPAEVTRLREKVAKLRADNAGATELNAARRELAAAMFGVDEREINFTHNAGGRDAAKINVNAKLASDAHARGRVGAEQEHQSFDAKRSSALEIDFQELEGKYNSKSKTWEPSIDQVNGILYHEASHQADYSATQRWVEKYEKATGFKFDNSGGEDQTFRMWMLKQKGVDEATRSLVINMAGGYTGDTEVRAYMGAAMAALRAGSPEAARDQIMTYARETGKGGHVNLPTPQAAKQVFDEMKRAYRELPEAMQRELRALLAEANAANAGWPGNDVKLK